MTVCGEKVTGVCVAAKCSHFKCCCPVVWDKYGKIEPQTNEEWRKTCSAEEFADFLAGVAHAGAYEVRNCNTNGMLQTQNTDFWLTWLKEKHDGNT